MRVYINFKATITRNNNDFIYNFQDPLVMYDLVNLHTRYNLDVKQHRLMKTVIITCVFPT